MVSRLSSVLSQEFLGENHVGQAILPGVPSGPGFQAVSRLKGGCGQDWPPYTKRILAAVLILSVSPLLWAAKKPKDSKAASSAPQRMTIDTSNLLWPQPPELTRIRYVTMYTGEKFDPAILEEPKTKKRNWKDVLAGAQAANERNIKIPLQFIRVYGVGADSKGNIYAADQAAGAVFIIDPATKDAGLIRNGHEARFGLINGLALDENDRLFVSDSKFHHVLVFNAKHQQEAIFGGEVLANPGGLAIDRENRFVYVADAQRDQVLVFDADNYKLLRTIGVTGKKHTLTDPGTFSLPSNVAIDREGDVYVTDMLNDRVEIFDPDGNFVSEFGKAGDGPGRFARPKGIAVDCDRHIWVVDEVQSRVQVFDRQGRLLIYFGEQGPYPGQFSAAYGIAIDQKNNVIVSEQFPGRVQVFQYVTDAEAEEARKKQAGPEQSSANVVEKDNAPATAQSSAAHAPR